MNLRDYIDPVELEKPDEYFLQSDELLSKKIEIHTESHLPEDLSTFDVAILGVPEDRNSFNKGCALAPNQIRSELYKLINPAPKLKILDLGNLKAGNTFTDTYFALKEVLRLLNNNRVVSILVGGSQDITLAVFQAFEHNNDQINLATIDSRIDSHKDALKPDADSYLFELLLKKRKLFNYINIGHQAYLTDRHNVELLNKFFHSALRLGEIRNDMKQIEPLLRDTHIVSFDINAVRQSDAPGHFRPSPNGFYSEEACQIARYTGTCDMVRCFGIFEVNPKFDNNNHTAALAAQMIWHFIDGLACRIIEVPSEENTNYKTFIVGHSDLDYDMTFYRSMVTDRWWLEIPKVNSEEKIIIACSYQDYEMACNHEVPEIWWSNFQKLS